MTSVALLGTTGLVGRHCLDFLASDRTFERIVAIARRRFGEAMAPRVEAHVVDVAHLELHPELLRVDMVICALGTTIKDVGGSRDAFREVDYGIPLTAARMALREGARHFLLVSALGANSRSRIFYSRVKGELEDALRALGYRALTIVRPSFLLGDRQVSRPREDIVKRFAWLLPGKYRPIHARDVAAILVRAAQADAPGVHVIEPGAS